MDLNREVAEKVMGLRWFESLGGWFPDKENLILDDIVYWNPWMGRSNFSYKDNKK